VSLVRHERVGMSEARLDGTASPVIAPTVDSPGVPEFVVVEFQPRHAWGLFLKATGGLLFRVTPNRDPDQPRLWCLRVDRCISVGAVQPDGHGCLVGSGIAWSDLTAVFTTIRSELDEWLELPAQRNLRRWLIDATMSRPGRITVSSSRGLADVSYSITQEEGDAPEAPIPPADGTGTTGNAVYG
jgi:hypothetical protein